MIPKKIHAALERQGYRFVGKHSAVKVCLWCKKNLRGEGGCYKDQFYGIDSSRCCQMSPSVEFCHNRCLHCWRPVEYTVGKEIPRKDADKPEDVINGCIEAQRKMLMGFKGNSKVSREKYLKSCEPNQFAISLSGEPTLYLYLGELISLLRKRGKTSFVVTNGMNPKKLKELSRKKQLPTQLYLSVNAPNEELFKKMTRSTVKNGWKIFNETVKLFPKLKTRKVFRFTIVKGYNDVDLEGYAKIVNTGKPDFVEIKSYMAVGFSRQRLKYEDMPFHEEVRDFSQKLAKLTKLKILDEKIDSRVVLLGKSKKDMKIKGC